MKNLFATLAIALGAVIAIYGLIGTPPIKNLLPIDLMFPVGDQATHQYLRAVPAASQSTDYLPYALLASGLVILIVGVVFRHRLRGNAA